MYKVIGGDQQEYGPVTADELRHWIMDGRLSRQSLARNKAGGEWRMLADFPEFEQALQAQARAFPGAVLQSAEPSRQATSMPAGLTPRVQIGSCLARAARLVSENFGLLVGGSAMVWLVSFVIQVTPFLGPILYLFLDGVLYGGLYLVFLKRIRGQSTSVNEVLSGLGPGMAQLMLAGFLTTLLSSIAMFFCLAPWVYFVVAWVFAVPLVADKKLEFWSAMERSRRVVTRVWLPMAALLFLAFLPVITVQVYTWFKMMAYAYPEFEALSRSGSFDLKQIAEMTTKLEKVLAPLVMWNKLALLFNLPFAAGTIMYAYEDLFGDRGAQDS